MRPNTVQGCLPISAVIHPDKRATYPAGPTDVAKEWDRPRKFEHALGTVIRPDAAKVPRIIVDASISLKLLNVRVTSGQQIPLKSTMEKMLLLSE